jgi:hypothetical protein
MEYIQIPLPDFSFSEVVKLKAAKIIHERLKGSNITHGYGRYTEETRSVIKSGFYELNSKEDQLTFIAELINHVFYIKSEYKNSKGIPDHVLISGQQRFNDLQHFLYDLLHTITAVNFNEEIFSDEEVTGLNRKIDAILILLDKLQVGQEVIFNQVDELKSDLRSLKSDYIAGKKKWYQRLMGIVGTFAGEKGMEVILEQLKPLLKDFFTTAVPHFIANL